MPVPRTPNPLPAAPLRRQEAERRLRDAIVRGELAPGERLTEDDLAAWLGVSRTPVREALGRLASAGLVEIDANRGARVAPCDPDESLDLVQVSRELVLLAQRLAAERATDEELRAMRAHHEARLTALRADDAEGVERSAALFHATILGACRSQELQRVYSMVYPRLERVFRVAYAEWLREDGAELDGRILEALEDRDAVSVLRVSGIGWDTLEANIRARADRFGAEAAEAATVARAAAEADVAGADTDGAA